jgi:hypothetical protein
MQPTTLSSASRRRLRKLSEVFVGREELRKNERDVVDGSGERSPEALRPKSAG